MKQEDKVDRKRERTRIREKHKEVKRKEKQERIASTQVCSKPSNFQIFFVLKLLYGKYTANFSDIAIFFLSHRP